MAIMALYVLSSTFFMAGATFILKVSRICRDNSKCVLKDDKFEPTKLKNRTLQHRIMENYYAPFLVKLPVKLLGLFLTLVVLSVSILGVFNLKQDFNPVWFLPKDSYGRRYASMNDIYFPHDGQSAAVYCGNMDYFNSKQKFEELYTKLCESEYISNGSVDSWFKSFTDWLSRTSSTSVAAQLQRLGKDRYPYDEATFMSLLQFYLTSDPSGLRHSQEVLISSSHEVLQINASFFKFQHRIFNSSKEEIEAMDNTQSIINSIFGGDCFAYSEVYNLYETNRVIQTELYRNLGIAMCCVFVVTLILIANFVTSLMVFSCVFLTLINVGGFLHFMGLTIDTCTSIILILSVGLAVDYSEHIGVCFMRMTGTRNERVKSTLSEMGVAVFNGGISTFLAFIVVAFSKSYVFTTFFKVFFLIVLFGLFHGLVYLPILLSLFGPKPYQSAYTTDVIMTYEKGDPVLEKSQTETTLLSDIQSNANDGIT
ncbi:hypothetical protein KUTeg_016953 [Tegillarca granosa]|uniref:SSD domain-containing protein n=1 Tax=Tegillarca granosa TaxID=220873 RepID=A0ABQ9EMD3_TEGGR|nr:hypothetical protein KUTeg_016953 [Tegillarca granosa]